MHHLITNKTISSKNNRKRQTRTNPFGVDIFRNCNRVHKYETTPKPGSYKIKSVKNYERKT